MCEDPAVQEHVGDELPDGELLDEVRGAQAERQPELGQNEGDDEQPATLAIMIALIAGVSGPGPNGYEIPDGAG